MNGDGGEKISHRALELRPDPVGQLHGGNNLSGAAPFGQGDLKARITQNGQGQTLGFGNRRKPLHQRLFDQEMRPAEKYLVAALIEGRLGRRRVYQLPVPIVQGA